MAQSDNTLQNQAIRFLMSRLPHGWRLKPHSPDQARDNQPGFVAELKAPDGKKIRLLLECKRGLEPRQVQALAGHMASFLSRARNTVPVVVSPFLTPRTRQLLREAELSFLDLTGNCWIVSRSPGLFISTSGQETNPQVEDRPVRSLKGPIAGRIVRALCDFFPPVGVRELASRAHADPGYVSRILTLLEREALIVRKGRGTVEDVKWKDLLHKWAEDYSPLGPHRVHNYLEPRGLTAFVDKLRGLPGPYALTASLAAATVAPVAPPRLAMCYVDDVEQAAAFLDLRPAEVGINVMLLTPFDEVVYERTRTDKHISFAALTQVAADLLHSPGRGPEEATALLDWMARDEHVWRT